MGYPQKLICKITNMPFGVAESEARLRETLAFAIGGKVFPWPDPEIAPAERKRRRFAFRNERFLYRNSSAISGKPIISSFSPDKPYSVVSRSEWFALDNCEFGRDFDFSRTFFEQFAELYSQTFKPNVCQDGEMENSEYNHFCGWCKNCYLTFDSGKNEDCSYGVLFGYCKNCLDCFYAFQCELCYQCTKVQNCYQLYFSQFSENCSFSAFLSDCIGCKNCIACVNLRNKEYYLFNKYVGRAEFERFQKEYFTGSYNKFLELNQRYNDFLLTVPKRALRNINCQDSLGDMLTSCQEVYHSYNCTQAKNCWYCDDCVDIESCLDLTTFGESTNHCYELSGCGGAKGRTGVSNCYFSTYVYYGGYNILYSIGCHLNSKNLFGCADLSRKEYCILNKQYTQADYEALLPKIIEHMQKTGEWGRFFPMSLSPYAYNESLAQEFYPISKEQAQALGAKWTDYRAPTPGISNTIEAGSLPDSVHELEESIQGVGIVCSITGKIFRPNAQELSFYRLHGLPFPRVHPEERHLQRARQHNPRELLIATCALSGESIITTYPANLGEKVYSEKAYLDTLE